MEFFTNVLILSLLADEIANIGSHCVHRRSWLFVLWRTWPPHYRLSQTGGDTEQAGAEHRPQGLSGVGCCRLVKQRGKLPQIVQTETTDAGKKSEVKSPYHLIMYSGDTILFMCFSLYR